MLNFRFTIVWHNGFHRLENTLYVYDLFTGEDEFPTYIKYNVEDIEKFSKFVYWVCSDFFLFFLNSDSKFACNSGQRTIQWFALGGHKCEWDYVAFDLFVIHIHGMCFLSNCAIPTKGIVDALVILLSLSSNHHEHAGFSSKQSKSSSAHSAFTSSSSAGLLLSFSLHHEFVDESGGIRI